MIVDNGKYYLYRHIRLDKNVPFYIGIGTRNTRFAKGHRSDYQRAYNKVTRSKIWWDIVNKTPYQVEIMLESDDNDFIKQKEREFINLYGRINLRNGTLSNLTDGGEGKYNTIISAETKVKQSLNHRSRGKFGKDNILSIGFYKYDSQGNFIEECIGILDQSRKLNVAPGSISSCLRRKAKSCAGYQFFYDYKGVKTNPVIYNKLNLRVGVNMLHPVTYEILHSFDSTVEAAKHINGQSSEISRCCTGKRNRDFHKGYKWQYKTSINDE